MYYKSLYEVEKYSHKFIKIHSGYLKSKFKRQVITPILPQFHAFTARAPAPALSTR